VNAEAAGIQVIMSVQWFVLVSCVFHFFM